MIRPISIVFLTSLSAVFAAARCFAADEGAAGKEVTIEEFLQQLSTVQGVVSRRDPFAELGPPFEVTPAEQQGENPDAPVMGAPILERYPIVNYEVVAVLLGDNYPRALLRLPGEGGGSTGKKVVIVKEGDKLGNHKGVISKIVLEGVIVQQAVRGAHGFVDKTEVLLKVGGRAEDQKKSLQTKPEAK